MKLPILLLIITCVSAAINLNGFEADLKSYHEEVECISTQIINEFQSCIEQLGEEYILLKRNHLCEKNGNYYLISEGKTLHLPFLNYTYMGYSFPFVESKKYYYQCTNKKCKNIWDSDLRTFLCPKCGRPGSIMQNR